MTTLLAKESIIEGIQQYKKDINKKKKQIRQMESYINDKNEELTHYLEDYFKDRVPKLIAEMEKHNTSHLNLLIEKEDSTGKYISYIKFDATYDMGWNVDYYGDDDDITVSFEIRVAKDTILLYCPAEIGDCGWEYPSVSDYSVEAIERFVNDLIASISYINADFSHLQDGFKISFDLTE